MKYKSSLKLGHPDAIFVRRRGRLLVVCKTDRRFNMAQKGSARKTK